MTLKASLLACLIVLTGYVHSAQACDTRHFYNNSSVPFILAMTPSGTCSIGGFTGVICQIPAGATADIHYPNGTGTDIAVASGDGVVYPGSAFSVELSCYINHSGSTGNIVVNAPADGDITTCGGSGYSCSPNKPLDKEKK